MKTLIVYDSVYGNTEKIAKAIGDAIAGEVEVLRVGDVNVGDLETADLLIIGSPIPDSRRDGSESLAMPQEDSLAA
jgi:flavodoxin